MTLKNRETSAKNALRYGHFKKAIVHLKVLLATEKRVEWIDWAQTAHSALAQQLAQQKNFQEVVKLFASGHRLCDLSLENPVYINALQKMNRLDEALDHYLRLSQKELLDKNDKVALSIIRSQFAAYAIAGVSEIIEQLPENDPIFVDFDKAYQLLDAYCHSDDESVKRNLKLISFRSPYRDLRQIIAAAIQLDESNATGDVAGIEKSRHALAHISPDSAFSKLAELLHLTSADTQDILSPFLSLNSDSQNLVLHMKGWQKEQVKIIERLANLPSEPDFNTLFRVADEYQKDQPEFCTEIAKIALIHAKTKNHKVVTLKRYEQRFGNLSFLDKYHIDALYETLYLNSGLKLEEYYFDPEEEFDDYEETWEIFIDVINDSKHLPKIIKQNISLIKALIYRNFSKQRCKKNKPDQNSADYLQESLFFDPSDKEAHIELNRYFLDNNQLKDARDNLAIALDYYPDNLEILLLSIESAIASGAYKKAAKYAKKILDVDPINRQARTLLCNAHLSHARKQAKIGKWHLVEVELNDAEQWAGDQTQIQASIAVLRANMAVAQKQNKQATELLKTIKEIVDTELNASLIIHLEATSINADAKKLHRLAKLKWKPAKNQGIDILFSFIDLGKTCFEHYHEKIILQSINALLPALQTIKLEAVSLQDYEKILEFCWHPFKLYNLLDIYINKAIKEHGDIPLLVYYRYINKRYLSIDEYRKITRMIDQARDQGDSKIASRLITLLEKSGPPLSFLNELDDDEFDEFDEFDENLPPKNLEEIHKLLPELIHLAASDADITKMLKDIMSLNQSEINEYKVIIGMEGLKDMLIAFITNGTQPNDFIADYDNNSEGKEKGKTKKKSIFPFNLFGDNNE